MSKSTIQRIGKGCSGCVFNTKRLAELTGGNTKRYIHVCTKNKHILHTKFRMDDEYHSCFVRR